MTTALYTYDVFISHSPADRAWVREWLLPRLEAAGIRACVDYRDFDVGAPVLENRARAVEQSRHTLLILTPEWLDSELGVFESLLAQSADPAARERRLLPLMLRDCQPSSRLAILDYADFTDPAEREGQLERLIGVIALQITPRQAVMLPSARRAARTPFLLPQLDVTSFTGRADELRALEALLIQPSGPKVCSIVGLAGTGGIGKSALACHFAQIHRAHFPDGVVGLRVDGKDVDTLAREFARPFEPVEPDDERDAATIMQDVFAHRRALLIFDNADDPAIRALRPGGDTCAVIVTTRDRGLPLLIDVPPSGRIDLPALSDADALALLERLLGAERVAAELASARQILELVGNLPLAIQIVGATLQIQPRNLTRYAESLSLARLKVRGDEHMNVRASFALSLELLEDPAEVDFFACLSVCAPDGFAIRTAMAAAGCDEDSADEQLSFLYRMSLLNHTDAGPQRFVFHPLIRMFATEIANERGLRHAAAERHARLFTALVKSGDLAEPAVAAAIAEDLDDIVLAAEWLQQQAIADYEFVIRLQPFFEQNGHWNTATNLMSGFLVLAEHNADWQAATQFRIQQAKYLSLRGEWQPALHVLEPVAGIIQLIEPPHLRQRTEAMWLNTLGGVLQRQGQFDEAVSMFQRSARIEAQIGNIRGQAKVLNSLGGILQRQGHFDQAADIFRESAAIEAKNGNLHGQAMVLNSLGGVLQRQGHFGQAAEAFEQSQQLLVALGDLRGQAMVLNSLGGVLQRQGHFDAAVDVLERSAALEARLGNLRGQAIVLNSLGGVLQRQGRFDAAVDTFRKSVVIGEQLGDKRHCAMALNSLGGALQRQGHFDQAIDVFERSLAISERLDNQVTVAMVLNSLGGVLQRQGRFDQAIDVLKRSLAISEHLDNQVTVAMVLNSLGGVLQRQGRFDQAVDAFERSLTISEQLGDLRSLAMVLNSLGGVLQRQGRFDQAVDAFERSRVISEQLGDLRSLAMVLNSLGGALQRQGRFGQAAEAFEQSQQLLVALGDLRGQAMVLNGLGGVLQRQGRFDAAIDAFERSYSLLVELGDHRGQAMVLNSLGGVFHRQRRFDAAIDAFERSIALGEQLGDQRHLAMAHTSLGKALLARGDTPAAADQLGQGFGIDERLRNSRGVGIVAPLLIRALTRLGRLADAQAICRHALALAPQNRDLLELRDQLGSPQPSLASVPAQGQVKRVIRHPQGYLYGFITPDAAESDIYFRESDLAPEALPMPVAGTRVAFEAETAPDGRRRARNIRLLD